MARSRKPLPTRIGTESKSPIPDQEQVLARNLAAAFIAGNQGYRSLDCVRRRWAHPPVGEFWLSLARMVMEHMEQHSALPPRTPPTIQ